LIDAYAHIVPPRYLEHVERLLQSWQPSERVRHYGSWLREDQVLGDLDARWRLLDRFPGYRQVLVLGVFPTEELPDSLNVARAVNDELAELVRDHPDRLVGFAAELALTDVDASLVELERAVRELGALGFQLHTNVAGRPLDDPAFAPVFARAEELGCTIWLHPARGPVPPDYAAESESKYGIWWSLGWPFETAAAMARLVYSGVLQRHPDLKIITHHGGGMLPHFAGRLDTIQADDQVEAFARIGNPIEHFKRFYADTAFFGASHALRSSYEFFGPDRMLFGSDMPLGGPDVIADTLADIATLNLSEVDQTKILRGNAERVLAAR
jgi:predicted TIM-barrel fold metal-dependent hydrolase